jgi:hypothetical protein
MSAMIRWAAGLTVAACCAAAPAAAQDFGGFEQSATPGLFSIFDEVRVGALTSIQPDYDSGVLVSGQLYFKPFGSPRQNYFANTFLRPRLHVGGNFAPEEDGINQIYGGLTWHFPLPGPIFLEASFGGTWHDGPIESPGDGLDLGCHVLFHESAGIGVDLGERWRVVGVVEHSSHANLCDGGNAGISNAGAYVGYRF